MSTATRIDNDTIEKVNRHSSRMTQLQADLTNQRQRSQASIQNDRRRAALRENDDLQDQCDQLREELREAHELINYWANGSEAFRRTMRHFHENWTPPEGEETALDKIIDRKHAEARQDPEWIARREALNSQQRERIRQRKRQQAPR